MISKKRYNKNPNKKKVNSHQKGTKSRQVDRPSFVVSHEYKVQRSEELLTFLLSKNFSRTTAKSLLTKHQVLVNGSVVSQYNLMLAHDDEVKITKRSVKEVHANSALKQKNVQIKLPFQIIYQDDDIIAINKPAGLLSVESDKENESAYDYLLKYFQQKDKKSRPYIVHRIDKETSGVLIFAKNIIIHSKLKMHWNELVKTREYYAIVEGKMEQKEGTFVSYLTKDKNNLMHSNFNKIGQKSITHYQVIKFNDDYSIMKVLIDTGRKNQIRVHMHDIHHSIVGDEKYGYSKNPLNRLGLHASKLEFVNPNNNQLVSISAPIPHEFDKLFDKQ